METFVYSCPSCGAKVDYNENTRLWECSYCGNIYEAVFENDGSNLPKIEDINYQIYRYNCDKCEQPFFSILEKDGLCNNCNNVVKKKGEPVTIHNVIKKDVEVGMVVQSYKNKLIKRSEKIHNSYTGNNFVLAYFECDVYQGVIKFTYGNKTKKYIFADLLVPNIDYEDYRFMYEVAKTKVKISSHLDNKNVDLMPLTNNIVCSRTLIKADKSLIDEDTLVELCRNHFIINNNIGNINDIKEEKSLSCSKGTYIPFYVLEHNKNNIIYREYKFGNTSFNTSDNLITEFDDQSIDKEVFSMAMHHIGAAIALPLVLLYLVFLFSLDDGHGYIDSHMKVIIFLGLLILSICKLYKNYKIITKKMESSRLMTRQEYINTLINDEQIIVIGNRNKR